MTPAEGAPTYRAAIVGTGRIGNSYDDEDVTERRPPGFYRGEFRHLGIYAVLPVNHADAYLTTPGFELVAAANRSGDKLRAFGERTGVRALYTDFRRMLREQRPDVLSVCTHSPEKAEIVVTAAEAGVRAIVVEKALATSMAEADAMIAACEQTGTLLATNHPFRFSPIVRETKRLIDSGEIGRLGTTSAHGRSGMLHIGTHTFDLLRFWAGDVAEVTARVPDYAPEKDLAATGLLQFKGGVTGFFDHVQDVQRGFEARGTGGYLTTSSLVGDGWLYQSRPLEHGEQPVDPRKQKKVVKRLVATPIDGEPHRLSLTQRLLSELYHNLTTGAPFISTGRDGAAALEVGLACYVSHLAGGPIQLPLGDRGFRVPNR